MTVAKALARPDALVEICMRVPAMGRKSVRELQLLLSQASAMRQYIKLSEDH
jgi:uncharacterized protein with von Willebrand factor type A (vWA) domain